MTTKQNLQAGTKVSTPNGTGTVKGIHTQWSQELVSVLMDAKIGPFANSQSFPVADVTVIN